MTRLIAPAPRLLHRDVRRFVRLCEGLALLASILSRIGLDGRDESIGLAIAVSEAAQRALDSLGSDQEGADANASIVLAVLESEQIEWIRWAAEQPELRALQSRESVLAAATRDRLVRVIRMSTLDDLGTVVLGPLLGNG